MNWTSKITELLNYNKHVTVFTQDFGAVMTFLNNEPGMWTVDVNQLWWPKLTDCPKNKWKIVKDNADVGLDCHGKRLTITKNPFRPIQARSVVIKDFFLFPQINSADIYPPMTFIAANKNKKTAIISSDNKAFYDLHNQLVMNDIPHGLNEDAQLSIFNSTSYINDYDMVACYKRPIVPVLMPLHDCGSITIIGNRGITPKWEHCETIMKCLAQTPMSAQTFEFLAYQTLLHPRTLKDTLNFLCLTGSVKEIYPNGDVVIIQKKGKAPDDLNFHAIPEGTWTVAHLISHLKIKKEELFKLLKQFEGNGLIFSYAPSPHKVLWTIGIELSQEKYAKTIQTLTLNNQWLSEMDVNATLFINRHVEKYAQLHAKNYGIKAYFHKEGIIEVIDPIGKLALQD